MPLGGLGEEQTTFNYKLRRSTFFFFYKPDITIHISVQINPATLSISQEALPSSARGCPCSALIAFSLTDFRTCFRKYPPVMKLSLLRVHPMMCYVWERDHSCGITRGGPVVWWSSPWIQDPNCLSSNPSPSPAGRISLDTTCPPSLCTSPVSLLLLIGV